jgi:hypothetical protein
VVRALCEVTHVVDNLLVVRERVWPVCAAALRQALRADSRGCHDEGALQRAARRAEVRAATQHRGEDA